jgi:hypothetical protein
MKDEAPTIARLHGNFWNARVPSTSNDATRFLAVLNNISVKEMQFPNSSCLWEALLARDQRKHHMISLPQGHVSVTNRCLRLNL